MHGTCQYPQTLIKVYQMLSEYQHWTPKTTPANTNDLVFVQKQKNDKDKKFEDWKKNKICHHCGHKGHICPDCKTKEENFKMIVKTNQEDKQVDNKTKSESDKDKKTDIQALQIATMIIDSQHGECNFGFNNNDDDGAPLNLHNMILLNNQSISDIFCNQKKTKY